MGGPMLRVGGSFDFLPPALVSKSPVSGDLSALQRDSLRAPEPLLTS
jgi:hypothetical protein